MRRIINPNKISDPSPKTEANNTPTSEVSDSPIYTLSRPLYTNPRVFDELRIEPDNVNHPSHYISESGLEVIDVIKAFTSTLTGYKAVAEGNIIKYILRWPNKNGIEDLRKARWYLDDLIAYLEKQSESK